MFFEYVKFKSLFVNKNTIILQTLKYWTSVHYLEKTEVIIMPHAPSHEGIKHCFLGKVMSLFPVCPIRYSLRVKAIRIGKDSMTGSSPASTIKL